MYVLSKCFQVHYYHYVTSLSFHCLLGWLDHMLIQFHFYGLHTHFGRSSLTPGIVFHGLPMSDLAGVMFATQGCEGHILGQMEVPVLFEGQVSLIGVRELHSVLQ